MKILKYRINTCMGRIDNYYGDRLDFLTDKERKEFDTIGNTGRNSKHEKTTYVEYLNTLNKGKFDIVQTKRDNGDFCESFIIIRVIKNNHESN